MAHPPIKPRDYKLFATALVGDSNASAHQLKIFAKAALKQTFYGPFYSGSNVAFTLFTPITAPVVLSLTAVGAMFGAIGFALAAFGALLLSPFQFMFDKKQVNLLVVAKAGIIGSGLALALSLVSALLAALGPLLGLASLTGSTIATIADKCSKEPKDDADHFEAPAFG